MISLRLTFHRAPFILIACLWVFLIHFFCPHPSSSSCDFGLLVFLMTPLFLVCCLGCIPHVSRTVAGRLHFKQVVNRLKIPQGLSTLLFHRWSEVPSRGGVRSDSLYEKLPALQSQRCHLSVFSKSCFLELLARRFSIRTLLLTGFVVCSHL